MYFGLPSQTLAVFWRVILSLNHRGVGCFGKKSCLFVIVVLFCVSVLQVVLFSDFVHKWSIYGAESGCLVVF